MLFDSLFENASNIGSLDLYVKENIEEIASFSNQVFSEINCNKDSIVSFILLKHQVLKSLDYDKSYNKAFISILIEICERLGESSCIVSLYSIFQENEIYLGERLNAVLLYLYNIRDRNQYIDRFDEICLKLTYSIENEEDNINKPVASFLNYYAYVVYNTQPHLQFADRLKHIIEEAIKEKKYSFLEHEFIREILNISFSNIENHFTESQKLVDSLLGKIDYVEKYFDSKELLIENGTDYATILKNTEKNFISVRNISTNKIKEFKEIDKIFHSLGRGVAIIESEAQMYSYMNSYGSAHHAKMLSALDKISFDEIINDCEILDWSCGQGLASMVFYEYLHNNSISLNLRRVNLIEPSNICLKRASLHVRHFDENSNIKTIYKDIDSLTLFDVETDTKNTKIHFFSNILDVEDFSMIKLIDLIESTQKGLNYFLCVSPYITDKKTDRVDGFRRYFEKKYNSYKTLGVDTNGGRFDDEYWCCNNKYKNCMCSTHPYHCNGEKKWTRIIRVFKVVI